MNEFPRYLAIAMVIALGLAFSPEVSANPPDVNGLHDHVITGSPAGIPDGCKNSPVVIPNPLCPK